MCFFLDFGRVKIDLKPCTLDGFTTHEHFGGSFDSEFYHIRILYILIESGASSEFDLQIGVTSSRACNNNPKLGWDHRVKHPLCWSIFAGSTIICEYVIAQPRFEERYHMVSLLGWFQGHAKSLPLKSEHATWNDLRWRWTVDSAPAEAHRRRGGEGASKWPSTKALGLLAEAGWSFFQEKDSEKCARSWNHMSNHLGKMHPAPSFTAPSLFQRHIEVFLPGSKPDDLQATFTLQFTKRYLRPEHVLTITDDENLDMLFEIDCHSISKP